MAQLDPLHFLNFGPQNTFQASGQLRTSPQDVDNLIEHLRSNPPPHLTLHFHGGLVGERSGMETAERLIPAYKAANSHPIVFVWETGLGETIKDNLLSIHATDLAKLIVKFGLQKLENAFGQAIGVKGPGDELGFEEIEDKLDEDDPFAELDSQAQQAALDMDIFTIRSLEGKFEADLQQSLAADPDLSQLLADEAPQAELLNPEFKEEVKDDTGQKGGAVTLFVAKKLAKIMIQTVKRFKARTQHGIYPTLIEEMLRELYLADLGAWVWGGMKKKAAEMWLPNQGPVTEFSRVGDTFLTKLAALPNPPALNLVGHSTGGIVICHLMQTLADRYPQIHTNTVAFLAPGCRTDLFFEQIASKPERFDRFRMFTMEDGFETQDRLVPGFYTHSLLYLVSGILEDKADTPLLGMMRYFSGQEPYTDPTTLKVRDFLFEAGKDRLVLSVSQPSVGIGLRSLASKHGDFDNDPPTLESLQHLLAG